MLCPCLRLVSQKRRKIEKPRSIQLVAVIAVCQPFSPASHPIISSLCWKVNTATLYFVITYHFPLLLLLFCKPSSLLRQTLWLLHLTSRSLWLLSLWLGTLTTPLTSTRSYTRCASSRPRTPSASLHLSRIICRRGHKDLGIPPEGPAEAHP